MTLEITSIRSAPNDAVAIEITAGNGEHSCKETFVICARAYADMHICKGLCSKELYDTLERESKMHAAFIRWVYILGFGSCSEKMLLSKLVQKGIDKEIAKGALDRIRKRGYIDDTEGAVREAEKCVQKLWGVSRIKASLIQKGYSSEAADTAIFALEDAQVDFEENCAKLIERKYASLPTDRNDIQKMIAAMCRYGYSISQIKNAYASLAKERERKAIYRN